MTYENPLILQLQQIHQVQQMINYLLLNQQLQMLDMQNQVMVNK